MRLPRIISVIAVVTVSHVARAKPESTAVTKKSSAVVVRSGSGPRLEHTVPPQLAAGRAQLIEDILYDSDMRKKSTRASLVALAARNRLEVTTRTAEDHPAATPRRRLIVTDEAGLAAVIPSYDDTNTVVIDIGGDFTLSKASLLWAQGAIGYGAAHQIEIIGCTDVTLNGGGNTLTAASGDEPGGFLIHNSAVTITSLTLSGFKSTDNGGGIQVYSTPMLASTVLLTGVTVSYCTSTSGGGGIWSTNSAVTMTTVAVDHGSAGESGGGIGIRGGNVVMTGVDITDNTAAGGGAFGGGGLYVDGATVSCTGCYIDSNSMTGKYSGGGIYAHRVYSSDPTYGHLTLVDTTVVSNTCANEGGGIGASELPITITGGKVLLNSAVQGGGINVDSSVVLTISGHCPLYVNQAELGGALSMSGSNTKVTIDNSPMTYNFGSVASGGAVLVASGTLTVTNSHISGNYVAGPEFTVVTNSGSGTCTTAGGELLIMHSKPSFISPRAGSCSCWCKTCSVPFSQYTVGT